MANKFKLNEDWIKKGVDEPCIEFMEAFGLYLCDKKSKEEKFPGYNAVTTAQMRNIYSEVKRIEVKVTSPDAWEKEYPNVLLLRPKIAYSAARVLSSKKDSRMSDLRDILDDGLKIVKTPESYRHFSQLFEGIIAYHKVFGGKD